MLAAPCYFPRIFRPNSLPLVLRFGGCWTTVRQLRPDDAEHLLEFFASHTPDTIHDRYGFQIARMSPERAARLVGVDQSRDAALGVFEPRKRCPLIAVGRYCLADDGCSAELAFVVREDRRCLGIATTLLRVLIAIARGRGLARLTAQVHADNRPMLAVFRRAGAKFTHFPGAGADDVNIELPADRTRASRAPCGGDASRSPSAVPRTTRTPLRRFRVPA